MRVATAPTVLASMPPLSTLTSREGQVDFQSSPCRRATSTSRIASTPAAIAAASGIRDWSGSDQRQNGLSGGGVARCGNGRFGLRRCLFGRVCMLAFAVGVGQLRCGCRLRLGWRLLGSCLLRCFLGGRGLLRGFRRSLLRRLLRGLGRWLLRRRGRRLRVAAAEPEAVSGARRLVGGPTIPMGSQAVWRQAFRRVDPAGRPFGCSFAVSRPQPFNPNR